MTMRSYDSHHELVVSPYKNGIKLLKPAVKNHSHFLQEKLTTVADVMQLPCNTYFLNYESKVMNANEETASTMYLDSTQETIGKSLADTPWPATSVACAHANDRMVMQNQVGSYFEEIDYNNTKTPIQHLAIKLPWYDKNDKIFGVFGFAIVLGKQPLSESLAVITDMGFINPFKMRMRSLQQFLALEAEQIYITPREADLIKLLIRGMRAPEIASQLKLSQRTIEHYTLSLKEKFHVTTKHELVERVLNFMDDYYIK